MNLIDLKKSPETFVSADDIAPILGCDGQSIRSQAQANPTKLGFPVIVIGRRVRIPRVPFLNFIGEGSK